MCFLILESEENNLREVRKIFPDQSVGSTLHIEMAGITYPDPTYHITRSHSHTWVVEYVTDGEGYINLEGKLCHVAKDMIYFLPARIAHDYYADPKNPYTKIFMNITDVNLCDHLVASFGLTGKYFFSGEGLKELFEKILITIHSDIDDYDMQSVFHGIFVEILSRLSHSEQIAAHDNEAMKIKRYLNANVHRIVSVKELSELIFRSQDYCLKLFRREFGITPYSYQLEMKMRIAKALLSDTNMSVGDIAASLGYDDLHYFSNLFNDKCGCRPLSYRKNNR